MAVLVLGRLVCGVRETPEMSFAVFLCRNATRQTEEN